MILKQRLNKPSSKLRVLSQLAAIPTCKPFKRANPKSPVARREQAKNIAGGEMLIRWWLPGDSPNTVETKQAEFRTQPEITVGRLNN
jgi:hypothetical protein